MATAVSCTSNVSPSLPSVRFRLPMSDSRIWRPTTAASVSTPWPAAVRAMVSAVCAVTSMFTTVPASPCTVNWLRRAARSVPRATVSPPPPVDTVVWRTAASVPCTVRLSAPVPSTRRTSSKPSKRRPLIAASAPPMPKPVRRPPDSVPAPAARLPLLSMRSASSPPPPLTVSRSATCASVVLPSWNWSAAAPPTMRARAPSCRPVTRTALAPSPNCTSSPSSLAPRLLKPMPAPRPRPVSSLAASVTLAATASPVLSTTTRSAPAPPSTLTRPRRLLALPPVALPVRAAVSTAAADPSSTRSSPPAPLIWIVLPAAVLRTATMSASLPPVTVLLPAAPMVPASSTSEPKSLPVSGFAASCWSTRSDTLLLASMTLPAWASRSSPTSSSTGPLPARTTLPAPRRRSCPAVSASATCRLTPPPVATIWPTSTDTPPVVARSMPVPARADSAMAAPAGPLRVMSSGLAAVPMLPCSAVRRMVLALISAAASFWRSTMERAALRSTAPRLLLARTRSRSPTISLIVRPCAPSAASDWVSVRRRAAAVPTWPASAASVSVGVMTWMPTAVPASMSPRRLLMWVVPSGLLIWPFSRISGVPVSLVLAMVTTVWPATTRDDQMKSAVSLALMVMSCPTCPVGLSVWMAPIRMSRVDALRMLTRSKPVEKLMSGRPWMRAIALTTLPKVLASRCAWVRLSISAGATAKTMRAELAPLLMMSATWNTGLVASRVTLACLTTWPAALISSSGASTLCMTTVALKSIRRFSATSRTALVPPTRISAKPSCWPVAA